MEDQRYAQLVNKAKDSSLHMEEVINLMNPIIKSYIKKLFFMDSEDAEQEITIAIIEAVQSIKACETDGQCLKYINNAIRYKHAHLCKNNIRKEGHEELDAINIERAEYIEKYVDIDLICDLIPKLTHMSENNKEILKYLYLGYTDKEIGKLLKVSRQYVNRAKKKLLMKEDKEDESK